MNLISMLANDIIDAVQSGSVTYADACTEFVRRGSSGSPKASRRAAKNIERLSSLVEEDSPVVDDHLESYGAQTDAEAWAEVLATSANRWVAYATLREQGWNATRIADAAGVKPSSVRNVWNNPGKGIEPKMPALS